jgi:hypothetical protein
MLEALSSWSTWAAVLGVWFAASAVSALLLAKFLRRADGRHAKNSPALSEVSEESERTSVVPPGFFSDFVDEPAKTLTVNESGRIDPSRASGTRFRAIDDLDNPRQLPERQQS